MGDVDGKAALHPLCFVKPHPANYPPLRSVANFQAVTALVGGQNAGKTRLRRSFFGRGGVLDGEIGD